MTFQELIMSLEKFWARQGCVIQQPYDIEVGAGTFRCNSSQGYRPRTMVRCLCPAFKKTNGWQIWGKSKPAWSLLSVSSYFEAVPLRHTGFIFRKP